MKQNHALRVLWLVTLLAGTTGAVEAKPLSVDQAIRAVEEPASGFGNMSPFELQTRYRLMGLLYEDRYKYEDTHADAWLKCMQDTRRSMYARLCAAYFLLDDRQEARDFVVSQLKSQNLRHRYNAAEIVLLHLRRDPKKKWDVETLIGLLADGSIDDSGVKSSPGGNFPQGDEDDIMYTPIDSICWALGFMKEKPAVPALISVLERRPKTGGAAFALGEIGDPRAIPILMKVLQDDSGYEDREATALGKFKHKEAVPILIARLSPSTDPFGGMSATKARRYLEALLEIGDRRAAAPIEEFLKRDCPQEAQRTARRVLVQLKSSDPVGDLLAVLEKESYEPERSDLVDALVKHPDDRVVKALTGIASSSDSAFMRRQAIFGLMRMGDQQSLLALALLLDIAYPRDLKAEWGWFKQSLPDFSVFFPETIQMCLKERTKQDFGPDRQKWEAWIRQNIQPRPAPR